MSINHSLRPNVCPAKCGDFFCCRLPNPSYSAFFATITESHFFLQDVRAECACRKEFHFLVF